MGLTAQPTHPLWVVVGNGNEVFVCHQLCVGVAVQIQGQNFTMDLHVLPLCGVDVVLGVQWLKSLRPILTDYNDLTMRFMSNGQIFKLKGDTNCGLHSFTPPQLCRMTRTDNASAYFHIRLLPPKLPSTKTTSPLYPKIENLIHKFGSLFQTPTTLPPSQNTNHSIPLLPTSKPVNVRPYHYPYF